MNKIAIITGFLGGVKNRYMQYQPNRTIEEKIRLAGSIEGIDGLELCYPEDFSDVKQLKKALADEGLGVSSINVRSRRQDRWTRGSFTSARKEEREEVVDDFKKVTEIAESLGVDKLTSCPLNDGHDYVFEMNYLEAYDDAADVFRRICELDKKMKYCIEYKVNDPRVRCLLGTAGESLAFCEYVGADNLGVTMDFGHSILGHERPAQALSMLYLAGRLFHVHLNDNDRLWDWDELPGAFNVNELIEFMYYLRKCNYDNSWYAFDITSKEVDTAEHFRLAAKITRKFEKLAASIPMDKMDELMGKRNPNDSFELMFDTVFGK